jgi:hypothetical protein
VLQSEGAIVLGLLIACDQVAVPIDQFGDPQGQFGAAEGYNYSQPAGAGDFLTTALDVSDSSDAQALWITGGDSSCNGEVNGLRHNAARVGLQLPHVSLHPSFAAHKP